MDFLDALIFFGFLFLVIGSRVVKFFVNEFKKAQQDMQGSEDTEIFHASQDDIKKYYNEIAGVDKTEEPAAAAKPPPLKAPQSHQQPTMAAGPTQPTPATSQSRQEPIQQLRRQAAPPKKLEESPVYLAKDKQIRALKHEVRRLQAKLKESERAERTLRLTSKKAAPFAETPDFNLRNTIQKKPQKRIRELILFHELLKKPKADEF